MAMIGTRFDIMAATCLGATLALGSHEELIYMPFNVWPLPLESVGVCDRTLRSSRHFQVTTFYQCEGPSYDLLKEW